MSSMIPFADGAQVPAYLRNRVAGQRSEVNAEVATKSVPRLSIKGKQFTLVRGAETKLLTRPSQEPGEPDEPRRTLDITVVRANRNYRTFYAAAYSPGDDERKAPDCFSSDGKTPDPSCASPQAKTCATCPQAVWQKVGTKEGTPCAPYTVAAIIDPTVSWDDVYQLRIPPASRKAFGDVVAALDARSMDYNMAVLRVGFDVEAESPKLTFRPVALLSEDAYASVAAKFNSDEVKDLIALNPRPAAAKPDLSAVEAAIAARQQQAPAIAAPVAEEDLPVAPLAPLAKAAPAPEPAPAPVAAKPAAKPKAVKPAPAPVATPAAEPSDDLLGDITQLLSNFDD